MKKKYIEPKMKFVKIDVNDIICTSPLTQSLDDATDEDGVVYD